MCFIGPNNIFVEGIGSMLVAEQFTELPPEKRIQQLCKCITGVIIPVICNHLVFIHMWLSSAFH
jgi:hypothetical protein